MRKRVRPTEHSDGENVSSSFRMQTKTTVCQEKKGLASKFWFWVKSGAFALCAIFIMMPILEELPEIIRQRVYYHRIRAPFVFDLSHPAELGLNHTINMYLEPEEGISLGIWHTVPDDKWKEAQGKDSAWYHRSLKDGSPVIIYLHGRTQTRAAKHRIGVINVLSSIGCHVLSMDYRGFGDSTGNPTEEDLTKDAVWLHRWAKENSGGSRVLIWGHSLGSGVKKMRSPLLFLHSEDDHLTTLRNAEQMYQAALSVQGDKRVRMVTFEGSLGYLHNGLYKDPRLPAIIKNFVVTTEEMS
ncbi:lysophosphatidylserine lipase ABHD12-like isoform X2 [Gadus macrocephalus]|uniref:lysophosphatidylserine lipase ABHD12-like isoform X2 n=1 Tax=Gadus macrocephalus TaxID=80720 RepID=UPI0028CB90A7|nr:lysophosphatidylserine lipase ABHD12-like isoform X2 [Gadus macrocephalus]